MSDEIIIEGDQAPAPAPVVVTVVTPESNDGSSEADLAELIELRAYKARIEEERLAELEAAAAAALVTAEIAVDLALSEPVEPEVIAEPEVTLEPKPDVAPTNTHAWFKEF